MRRERNTGGLGAWVAVAAAAHAGVAALLLCLPSRVLTPAGEGPAVEWVLAGAGADGSTTVMEAPSGAGAVMNGAFGAAQEISDFVPEETAERAPDHVAEAKLSGPVVLDASAEAVAESPDSSVASMEEDGTVEVVAKGPDVVTASVAAPPTSPARKAPPVQKRATASSAKAHAAAANPAAGGTVKAPEAGGSAEIGQNPTAAGGGTDGADPREVAAWQAALSAWISRNQTYPPAARYRHDQGVVQVRFSVDEAGSVIAVAVLRESGSAILDSAALALLRNARLPAPPSRLDPARRTITVPIRYRLQ